MSEPVEEDGWEQPAAQMAAEAEAYLSALQQVASGAAAETALPLLLLSVGQLCAAGARAGALVDVVPVERFEPDAGPDADLEKLREGLHELLGGLDDYCDVEDPVISTELAPGSLSADLVAVADDLFHGREHYLAGRVTEAMWWWQFSYLSSWGERAASALRVLLTLVAHVRLDADAEQVRAAELAALRGGT